MMTDPAGLGERLRVLGAEVSMLATGREAGLWLYALESLAGQADELERQRDEWRARITRVRAEAASWAWMEDPPGGEEDTAQSVTAAATVVWCSERIRFALDG